MMLCRWWWQRGSVVRRSVLIGVGWVTLAVLTVAIATEVLDMVGLGLGRSLTPPLTSAEVVRELAAHRTPGPSGSPSPSTSVVLTSSQPPQPSVTATSRTPARTVTKALTLTGVTVVARCSGDLVELLSWSPAQGYLVTAVSRGPAAAANVTFRASTIATTGDDEEDDGTARIVTVTCFNGVPRATVAKSGDD